jgi:FAD dependent oxidoreductase
MRTEIALSRKLVIVVVAAVLVPAQADSQNPQTQANATALTALDTDVCVYGGTSAGVAAAVQVARMGKRSVLVTPDQRLGGLTSNGLGWTDLASTDAIGGIAREFYHQVYLNYVKDSSWLQETREDYKRRSSLKPDDSHQLMFTFEPKVAAAIFDKLLTDAKVTVVHGRIRRPGGIKKTSGQILELDTDDGLTAVTAKEYIDASYEGDLLTEAGVAHTIGRESSSRYNETLAGIQTARATKNQLPTGIDPYRVRGNPGSGRLPNVNANAGGADGLSDKRLQAYCYRMCLTDVASNRVMIAQPANYQEANFELMFRAIAAGQTSRFFKVSPMPNRKTDSNNDNGFSTDFIGGNYDLNAGLNYAEAGYAQREDIARAHRDFQMGMVWTLQHHPRVPAAIRAAWSTWGLPLDEFPESGHWPTMPYIREARRMTSDFVITQHHVHQEPGFVVSDSVGLGGYNMDSHNVQRYVTAQGFVRNEGDIQVPPARGPYAISYRALVPRRADATNLLVPVCVSASHIAYGSVRMEPVFMILGQSAAVAAVLAIDGRTPVQDVSYSALASALLDAGQVLRK